MTIAPRKFKYDIAQQGDALALLQWLPDACSPLVIFDPQFRDGLDRLAYGNEGERQHERHELSAMTASYIDACCRESARVLAPSAYLEHFPSALNRRDSQPLSRRRIWGKLIRLGS